MADIVAVRTCHDSGWMPSVCLILISAELYLLYMFLDWRIGNWTAQESAGAERASLLSLGGCLLLQLLSAWKLGCSSLASKLRVFGVSLDSSDRPSWWRYLLSLIVSVVTTFLVAISLYFAT